MINIDGSTLNYDFRSQNDFNSPDDSTIKTGLQMLQFMNRNNPSGYEPPPLSKYAKAGPLWTTAHIFQRPEWAPLPLDLKESKEQNSLPKLRLGADTLADALTVLALGVMIGLARI